MSGPFAGAGGALSILIAEDNEDAAATLEALLTMRGHAVEVCTSGPAAVEVARQRNPDVLLCDIGLPGMSGYDVARTLRSNPGSADITLIAITGYSEAQDRKAALAAGFDMLLSKGGDPVAMLLEIERIANFCARAERHDGSR